MAVEMPARRPRRTPSQIADAKAKFIEALDAGATIDEAARAADLDPATPYVWRKVDEQFREEWEESVMRGVRKVERKLLVYAADDLTQPGAVTSAIFMLKSRLREVYGEKVETITTIKNAEPAPEVAEEISRWLESNPDKREAVRDLMSVVGEHDA